MQTAKDVVTTNSTKQVNVTVYNPRLSRSEAVEGLGIWIFKSYQLEFVSESLQRYHYITFDTKHISLLQLFSRFSISWNMLLYEKDPITFKWKNISVHICFQSQVKSQGGGRSQVAKWGILISPKMSVSVLRNFCCSVCSDWSYTCVLCLRGGFLQHVNCWGVGNTGGREKCQITAEIWLVFHRWSRLACLLG